MFKLFPEPSINVTKYSVRLHEKFAVNGTALQAFLFKAMIGKFRIHFLPHILPSQESETFLMPPQFIVNLLCFAPVHHDYLCSLSGSSFYLS